VQSYLGARHCFAPVKSLEVRRHSDRTRPDEHLSAAGRALAEEVGRTRGPFERVISSAATRAIETAESMGFSPEVSHEVWLDPVSTGQVPWPRTFNEYRILIDSDSGVRLRALEVRSELLTILESLGRDRQALVVGHGGLSELAVGTLSPARELATLGGPCRCMEGAYLTFEDGKCVSAKVLRVPSERTRL